MGNAGSRYQEELIPAESFGKTRSENISHSNGKLSSLLEAVDVIGGRGKNYAANQEARVSLPAQCIMLDLVREMALLVHIRCLQPMA
ncbi:unnamed protein product [Lasius platythorax]|uniref:Uncharacterized protein n=1 Tax=Lasius platythorax TaxID=488582 RepID=A0AAV2P010_9HYME